MTGLLLVACILSIFCALIMALGKNLLTTFFALWLEGFFVSIILFVKDFEFLGLVTLVIITMAVLVLSGMSGTIRGDLRETLSISNPKKYAVTVFVGLVVSFLFVGLIGFMGFKLTTSSGVSGPALTQIGQLMLTKYKIVTIVCGIFLLLASLGISIIVHFTDREAT